jgi:hypothetical protein
LLYSELLAFVLEGKRKLYLRFEFQAGIAASQVSFCRASRPWFSLA